MKLAVVALLLLVASGHSAAVSPVQKVIQLIDDMAVKVKKDLDQTGEEFQEYAKYCDDEATAKDYAVKGTKEQIESLQATVDDTSAKILSLESKVEGLTGKISGAEEELATAISLRSEEHADFLETEKEMLATVDSLNAATSELKKSLGFVQLTPTAQQGLDSVLASLGQIVDADFVTHEQRDKVQAFLQAQEDAQDSLTIKTEGGPDAIIGTLEDMTARAEGTLGNTRKGEMEGAHASAMLKQGIENEISSMKEELSESTKSKQANAEAKAGAEKDLAIEKKGLAEDEKYLRDLKMGCQSRASEFEVESKDANAELGALGKAKGILSKKFSSLIETREMVKVRSAQDDEQDDARVRALRHIQQLGQQYHSTMLVALAYRAAADPFVKVRGMVESMIDKLMQEAAEEASQKAFCDEEIGKSKKSQADKSESLAKLQSRLDKAESATASSTELVATLSREIKDIDAGVADATAVRNKEKAEFLAHEKDMSESEEACAAAIAVLREYYEGTSLVQVKSSTKRAMAKTSGDGSGILGVLEVAESDFARSLAEARTTEESSTEGYEKMMQENKMLKATKGVEVKGKQSELKRLKTSLSESNEDKESVGAELSAVNDYLDKLKPQCETKVPSYEEVKAKRDAEIQGLKEALDLLSGDGGASFLQTGLLRR